MKRGPLLLLAAFAAAGSLAVWLIVASGTDERGRTTGGRGSDIGRGDPEDGDAGTDLGSRGPDSGSGSGSGSTERTWRLTGTAKDPRGHAIEGAVVRSTGLRNGAEGFAFTDAEGEYGLDLVEPSVALDVYAEGYLPLAGLTNGVSNRRLDFFAEGKGPWKRNFTLKPAAKLTGTVTDESGRPVENATVYVVRSDQALLELKDVGNTAYTDKQGQFVFHGLPAGVTDVGVRASGHLPALARDVTIPEHGQEVVNLSLHKGRSVLVVIKAPGMDFGAPPHGDPSMESLLVVAADSRLRALQLPPSGTLGLVRGLPGRAFIDYPVAARSVGEWGTVSGMPGGAVDFVATADGYITEPGLGRKLDTTEDRVELTLIPGKPVIIRARDAVTREPIKPNIRRRTGGTTFPYEEPVFDDKTDAQLVRMPADDRQHELLFDLDGYDPAVRELPDLRGLTEGHVIDLEMAPAADAGESGTFYLEFEGETPPERVAVVGRKDGDNHWKYWQRYPKADEKGRWAVNGVPVGDYKVVVLAPGSVPVTLERVSVTTTLKDTFRVRLSPGGGLSFSVQDGSGNLLDKVYLDLRLDGNGIDIQVYNKVSDGSAYVSINYIPSAASASTDSGLASGNYTITAVKEGYKPATKTFSITGTETAEVTFSLQKTG